MIINSLVDSIVILNKSNNYGIANKGEKKKHSKSFFTHFVTLSAGWRPDANAVEEVGGFWGRGMAWKSLRSPGLDQNKWRRFCSGRKSDTWWRRRGDEGRDARPHKRRHTCRSAGRPHRGTIFPKCFLRRGVGGLGGWINQMQKRRGVALRLTSPWASSSSSSSLSNTCVVN